jgi:pyruvate formate lyase activating enzyme
MGLGESGYCGLRMNREGRLVEKSKKSRGLMHMYLDRLPTNCCAAWFCPGSKENGYNLAVFLYGCGFDCMYCQNSEHKFLDTAQKILDRSEGPVHICWEWNGSGNPKYVKKAAHISKKSKGTVKFDIKAFHPNVHTALCGRDNVQTLRNFKDVGALFPDDDILTATTLLVPYYVDQAEVSSIAQFISRINSRISYSLLVFHPDFYLDDLPVTPREQVFTCYDVAQQYLERVHIGNRQLL